MGRRGEFQPQPTHPGEGEDRDERVSDQRSLLDQERALREQILAEAVERLLTRADVVDAQLETIAGALIAAGRARR